MSSVYQDLSLTKVQICWIFVAQLALTVFYLNALFKLHDISAETVSYVFWFASFFIVQMGAIFNRGQDSQLGTVWNSSLWYDVSIHENYHFRLPTHTGGWQTLNAPRFELWARGFMGLTTHQIIRDVLA